MSIFEYDDYKHYIMDWIKHRPKNGRGEARKLSELLKVHTTMVSHILKGNSHLSLEQAIEVAQYIGLSELESDYFLELVQFSRAGTFKLKSKFKNRIESLRKKSLQLKERLLTEQKILSREDIAIFYSNWHFSAIRLLATIEETDRFEIGKKLNLSVAQINDALEFLTRVGVCKITTTGKVTALESITHLGADSIHIWKHHETWRLKAIERHYDLKDEEIMFSAPLTISNADMASFREKIVLLVKDLKHTVENTNPETVACLNIDWFKVVA